RLLGMIADVPTSRQLVEPSCQQGLTGGPRGALASNLRAFAGGGYGDGKRHHATRSRECGCEVRPVGRGGDRHRRLHGEQRSRAPQWHLQGRTLRPGHARRARRGVTGRDVAAAAWRIAVLAVALDAWIGRSPTFLGGRRAGWWWVARKLARRVQMGHRDASCRTT